MYKLDLYIREKLLQDFIMLQLKKKHKRATSRIFSEVDILHRNIDFVVLQLKPKRKIILYEVKMPDDKDDERWKAQHAEMSLVADEIYLISFEKCNKEIFDNVNSIICRNDDGWISFEEPGVIKQNPQRWKHEIHREILLRKLKRRLEVNIEPIQQMINRSEKESIKFVKNQKDEFYYNKWRRYGG
jgi:hypothetical protein